MDSVFSVFAWFLALFYSWVPNYGIAIVMLTLLVMLITTPLILKSTRSMMVMQQLQPEIKKLQSQYKDDPQKRNEELLKFYKENEISPLSGCLPLLIQMPVFIVLYQVLRGLTRRVSDLAGASGWNSGQLATGVTPSEYPSSFRLSENFEPAYISPDSTLYQSLVDSNTMKAFGMDLALSPSEALGKGVVTALPYLVFVVIVGVTGYVQQKQIQGRNKSAEVNPQQQMMMKIMPIILPFISFTLPAGLVLYFAVSNLYRVGQQWWISRTLYADDGAVGGGGKAAASKTKKDSPKKDSPKKDSAKKDSAKKDSAKKPASKKDADKKPAGKKPADKKDAGKKAGASSAKREKPKAKTGSKAPSKSSAGGAPTLQPRARRQKKR